jgi:CHAD domain-containing protein
VEARGPATSEEEVEWQFDALDLRPVERWLSALSPGRAVADNGGDVDGTDGGPVAFAVEPLTARRLVDAYLDTADWRISRSGFVLRVRQQAGRSEVTLKNAGERDDGLRRRLEVNEPLPDDGLGGLGADGPVGRRLSALVGNRPLGKVLEVRTRRLPYALRRGGAQVAEVTLDDTTIDVADDGPPLSMRRVEVEVDAGAVETVRPMVSRMRAECGLHPSVMSKFEAGLAASGLRVPGPPDVGPVELSASPSVGELAFVVLRRNLLAMLAHEAGTRLGEDPEELHDMRVATRRMRAALVMFADALPGRAQHLRVELGWIADALGAVRDLDVQLERVQQWTSEVPAEDRGALGDLARLLSHQRSDARRRLLAAVESTRYEDLVSALVDMLRQGPERGPVPATAPALAVVPELLRVRQRAVTKAATRARRSGDADHYHALRIRAKRLRYALEFVSELYGSHTAKYVRQLVRMQDTLGLLQDARVAADRLHSLVIERGDVLSHLTVFVMGGVAERYRQESARLVRRVPKRMKKLDGARWERVVGYLERRRLEAAPHLAWETTGWFVATDQPHTPATPLAGSNGHRLEAAAEEDSAPSS